MYGWCGIETAPSEGRELIVRDALGVDRRWRWRFIALASSSSVSQPSEDSGGEPAERKMPAAAAWVSVGELSAAEGPLSPLELRAMRM